MRSEPEYCWICRPLAASGYSAAALLWMLGQTGLWLSSKVSWTCSITRAQVLVGTPDDHGADLGEVGEEIFQPTVFDRARYVFSGYEYGDGEVWRLASDSQCGYSLRGTKVEYRECS